jgi:hypothetical protein
MTRISVFTDAESVSSILHGSPASGQRLGATSNEAKIPSSNGLFAGCGTGHLGFWSSSVNSNNDDNAYVFNGNNGNIDNDNRNNNNAVRCAGR